MAITTYTELKAAIANWLARDDLTSHIPEFITLAEAKLNRELSCYQMEKRSYAIINLASAEPQYITLPSDYSTMRRMRLSSVSGRPLISYLSGTQADEYIQRTGDETGKPAYYTVFGTEIELIPTPDSNYTIEMVYRANIDPLGDSTATNWLLTLAPDAYLYGALLEAAPFMGNDDRIQVWANAFKFVIDGINSLSAKATFGSSPLSVRVSGYTP